MKSLRFYGVGPSSHEIGVFRSFRLVMVSSLFKVPFYAGTRGCVIPCHLRMRMVHVLIRKRMEENFSRARNLLLGAVDTVLALANRGPSSHAANSQQAPPPRPGPSSRQLPPCSSSAGNTTGMPATNAGIDEHRRLFNYKGKRPVSQKRGSGRD